MADATMTLQRRASLHEASVQRVARPTWSPSPFRSRTTMSATAVALEPTRIVVRPDVWRVARRLAGDDPLRIQVVRPDCVIVHNNRNWRR